jgi:hypothetical protein
VGYITLDEFEELIQGNCRVVEVLAELDSRVCADWTGRSEEVVVGSGNNVLGPSLSLCD